MSIGNGLSFQTAAALAGINASSLFFGGSGGSDSSIDSGVGSLTSSHGFYTPSYLYPPTYTPSFSTINQVTNNGFGSSTNGFYTPSNSIFTGGNSFGPTNVFTNQLPGATGSNFGTGIRFNGNGSPPSNILDTGGSGTTRSLPPVNKAALDVTSGGSSTLTDPPA